MAVCNPFKEEDEGYLAAKTGRGLSENPYPRGTIRYQHWRHGWLTRRDEIENRDNDGYRAADSGQRISENPHPRGTIRYEQWRLGWLIKHDQDRRAIRLGHQDPVWEQLDPHEVM